MPYTGTAAAWPLYVAVSAALLADPAVSALLDAPDKVFNLRAPANTPGDYIVLGGITESEFWLFVQGGSDAVMTLHLWTKGADAAKAARLYGEVQRVLNRATLDIDGFDAMTGTLALVDIQPDADGQYAHGIVRYSMIAIRA